MPLERLEAEDERDVLEFLNVGLSSAEAQLLLDRLTREHGRADLATLVADAWLFGATAARFAMQGHRVCHVCGCWELRACEGPMGPCSWTGPNLCSECEATTP